MSANREPDLRRVLAAAHPSPVGNRPPLPEEEFRAYLATIRERGFVVTMPEVRFRAGMGPKIQQLVMQSAEQISEVLGHQRSLS